MTVDNPNPYASPMVDSTPPAQGDVDAITIAKAEVIIKEANQFWLAILMSIFCVFLGSLIIGPWYLFRLIQWSALARSQPLLVAPNAPRGSIAQRFRAARVKLIIGFSFGALAFLAFALLLLF